jgi:hypothetical protein
MNKPAAILLGTFFAFACMASADTIYNVSGTFGTSTVLTGPLNGGTFNGTFSATLPLTGPAELFTSFNINLITSSGTTLVNIASSTSGTTGSLGQGSVCAIGPSTIGSCDLFEFGLNLATGTDALELATPLDFTGGATYPGFFIPGGNDTSAATIGNTGPATDSLVASGSIELVAEPGTFALLGTALLAGLWIEQKRLFA